MEVLSCAGRGAHGNSHQIQANTVPHALGGREGYRGAKIRVRACR